ncbi:MAG TPA: sugar ABC transporter substrate-binding protein [Chloroflexota bacterium]|nr:sugar ABC transporter substrate-binding protein [Chloroflexota bacterium]
MRQQVRSRRSVLGAGVAVGAAAGAACVPGGAGGGGGQAPPAGVKSGVRVSFAYSAPPEVAGVMARAAQTLGEKVPGITAEYINTQGQNHNEKVTTAMAGGTPIDVFTLNPGDMVPFAHQGQVRAIDDLIRRDRYDATDFFEKCIGQYRWKGKGYALPRGFGNQDIYYNTAVWDGAGNKRPPYDWTSREWTTQEFLDAVLRVSRMSGSAGSSGAGVWGWNQGTGLRQWAPWVWVFGGDILDQQGAKCILDQGPAVEGLQFLQDLIHKHQVMPPPAARVNSMTAMGNGQLGMAMGIPSEVGRYRQIQGLAFDVAPMPKQATRLTSGGGIAWHMAAGTPHLNEAWELQKWVSSKDVQTWECEVGGTAPPRKSVIKSPCYNDRSGPPRGIDVFLQAPEFVHTDPQALGWAEAEEIVTAGLASLWDGSRTARQITQDAVPQINRLLQERAG